MTDQILIVDSDEAFATILKEGIELGNAYHATIATSASEAREISKREPVGMVIVDLGLEDEDPATLLQDLRDSHPHLRIVVIPVDDAPPNVLDLGIQGTLPKPFFLPDIPAQIDTAFARPVDAPLAERDFAEPRNEHVGTGDPIAEPAAEATEETNDHRVPLEPGSDILAHLARQSHRLTDHLRHLSRELNADAVMLTYRAELVAYAGHFGRVDAERLAQVVSASWQASARVAAALGREQVRFEQSLHEGEDYLLYSLATGENLVLSVALRADRPLGMIRYNTKRTAQDLQPLLLPR